MSAGEYSAVVAELDELEPDAYDAPEPARPAAPPEPFRVPAFLLDVAPPPPKDAELVETERLVSVALTTGSSERDRADARAELVRLVTEGRSSAVRRAAREGEAKALAAVRDAAVAEATKAAAAAREAHDSADASLAAAAAGADDARDRALAAEFVPLLFEASADFGSNPRAGAIRIAELWSDLAERVRVELGDDEGPAPMLLVSALCAAEHRPRLGHPDRVSLLVAEAGNAFRALRLRSGPASTALALQTLEARIEEWVAAHAFVPGDEDMAAALTRYVTRRRAMAFQAQIVATREEARAAALRASTGQSAGVFDLARETWKRQTAALEKLIAG